MSENLIHLSRKNLQKKIIGVDPFKNGMVNVSDYFIKNNIKNVYLYPFVFQKFLNKFKKLRFDIIYILFTDLWPKKKHKKKSIVNKQLLRQKLKNLKTNWKDNFKTNK